MGGYYVDLVKEGFPDRIGTGRDEGGYAFRKRFIIQAGEEREAFLKGVQGGRFLGRGHSLSSSFLKYAVHLLQGR